MKDNHDVEVETPNHEDDSTVNNPITTAFEILDTSIQHGSHNMKAMDSSLNLVIGLIEEVRLKEKSIEEAKKEAAKSGLDILAKAEALKQEQQRVKKANDMVHAREVSAQKAALAKELKELQYRLSGVLDVGDECLEGFDEMCKVLKVRLTKAVTEKELADQEKLKKEALAHEALAFEESQMLKLVEESNTLKQEAANNFKLQDLFKEREFVVNVLRVVSDKYPDISSLRERIDQHVLQPGGFISGSKTPSCFTSSSSSLARFLTPFHKLENEPLKESTADEHAQTNPPEMSP
ncbi:uncharacterized protein LOC143587196 [Bidens hawaiensis]|uniref:uncharacterized protein LOC143587196 n=1 Tax=Bidens hawaiensis TaxID=980011 RepID=UPI00404AD307